MRPAIPPSQLKVIDFGLLPYRTIWRPYELDAKLREIADSLAGDLARLDYSGKTLTLKLKLETYEVSTRAKTLDNGLLFHTAEQLYTHGKALLDTEVAARAAAYDDGRPFKGKGRDLRLRLMGLKVSGLRDDIAVKQKGKGALVEVRPVISAIPILTNSCALSSGRKKLQRNRTRRRGRRSPTLLRKPSISHCRMTVTQRMDLKT